MSTADETPLGQICLQVHPGRAPGLDVARLAEACEVVARRTPGIRGFGVSEGEDEGAYVNLVFAAEDPSQAWPPLWAALRALAEFGALLPPCCLAMCTGEQGWDDYRLLHHFDPDVALGEPGDDCRI